MKKSKADRKPSLSVVKSHTTDIIAIGASMGGFHALRQLISDLPADFAGSLFVVLHIPSDHKSFLAKMFGRKSRIQVQTATDGAQIEPGNVYVAGPDYHLQFKDGKISLDHGPKHNFHRPAVDTMFTSAAKEFGSRVIGVVLTGALDDGTAGLMEIKRNGGISIVQEPSDAINPSMPESALNCVPVDYCLPLSDIAKLLTELALQSVKKTHVNKGLMMPKPSEPELSTHICPECNGPMWFQETGKLIHFYCRIGHSFSGQSLLLEKTQALEKALWSAVNALKDKANIANRLADRSSNKNSSENTNEYFRSQAESAEIYANVISDILLKGNSPVVVAEKKLRSGKMSKKLKVS